MERAGAWSGPMYLGSAGSANEAPGVRGGLPSRVRPRSRTGRQGTGARGGLVGLRVYMQRTAIQRTRELVDGITAG